jgi:SAM-dependent methyltransferase
MSIQSRARHLLSAANRAILRLVLKSGALECYHPLPWIGYTPEDRVDAVKDRWEMIASRLPTGRFSALDIGCNAGFFSLKLAERGAFVTGIEQAKAMLWLARGVSASCDIDNVAFARSSIEPDNVEALPDYDVILLLSVYHHFIHFYGADRAKSMLGALIRRARRSLFFETSPGYDRESEILPDSGTFDETAALLESYPGVKRVELLGVRRCGAHDRALFVVEK